jgi:glutamine synthetase
VVQKEELAARPPELSDESVTCVRVLYPDLHGVARGKDVPIGEFERAIEHGLAFCSAVMGTDLRHTPVVGGEEGYPDLIAFPDLSTMTLVPWEPGVACCIADLHPVGEHPPPADPRGAVPSPASKRWVTPLSWDQSSSSSCASETPRRPVACVATWTT